MIQKSFEEIYQIVEETSSGEAAFNKEECRALYDLLVQLPEAAQVVEIGVQFGRSFSVIAEVAKERSLKFAAIDNWKEDVSKDAKANVEKQIAKYGWGNHLLDGDSKDLADYFPVGSIDLIHIDGDHTYEGVMADCKNYLHRLKQGGYVCFDDYGHDSLPEVWKATAQFFREEMMNGHDWQFIGRFGNKLGIYKKAENHIMQKFSSSEELAEWYDNKYKEMGGGWKIGKEEADRLIEWSTFDLTSKSKTLLDIGSGDGDFISHIDKLFACFGIELSEVGIEFANKRGLEATFLYMDIEDTSFDTAEFDYLTSIGSIEHVIDISQALSECYRILKAGGKFLVLVPNELWLHRDQPQEQTHTDEDWKALFEKAGFIVVKSNRRNDLTDFLLIKP